MFRFIVALGICLVLPGLASVVLSFANGPVAWTVDSRVFWGMPISLFVFWIGLAHAGTLISAIFLALNIKLDRRTSMLAELATLCALAVAAVFPLMHLGVVENFYMLIPFADARGNISNLRSPLVWDFCCIAIYAILSAVYFAIHAFDDKSKAIAKLRKPMAWLLFPLVFWVHTIVSLDFAVTFVPEWRGAFFPLYFIVGAIFSGLALVNLMLCGEGCRVRLLEKLCLMGSWFMSVFWLWDFVLKGTFSIPVFILAAVVPQLLFIYSVRESPYWRFAISLSIVIGMLIERIALLYPSPFESEKSFGLIDFGMIAFGFGTFLLLFLFARVKLFHLIEGEDVVMGEVVQPPKDDKKNDHSYFPPLTTPEFRKLRLPLFVGVVVTFSFIVFCVSRWPNEGVEFSVENVIPITYPLIAFVASIVLCRRQIWRLLGRLNKIVVLVVVIAVAFLIGILYAGGNSTPSAMNVQSTNALSSMDASTVFDAKCASCHGNDGRFNERFIREYYPVPQKLTMERLDSLGEDSLVNVIMNGRVNMNPYGNRISEGMARSLVQYMRNLAQEEEKE